MTTKTNKKTRQLSNLSVPNFELKYEKMFQIKFS